MKIKKTLSIVAPLTAVVLSGCGSDEPGNKVPDPVTPPVAQEAESSVIYEANPRFWGDGNSLNAIKDDLDRISGMGCDILWLMPVFEPGELKSVGSPYCVRNFTTVNPRYGSTADLKSLVQAAHGKGMKVILDWVANHTAWDNVWISSHPEYYKKDAAGNIAATASWGDVAQLDYSNAATHKAMKDAMLHWIEACDIDGFRCDYADGVPHDFWNAVITEARGKKKDFIMLAESADFSYYADGFDMIYDWSTAPVAATAFTGGKASSVISKSQEMLAKVPTGKSILRYALNHDVAAESDIARMYGTPEGARAAYVAIAMAGGTPMLYSGMDAEGVSGKLSFFNYNTLNFSETLSDEYAAINGAFKATAGLRGGTFGDYSGNDVICFTRRSADNYLLVMVNTTAKEQTQRTPITLSGETMENLIEGTKGKLPVTETLEPYGYRIYMK